MARTTSFITAQLIQGHQGYCSGKKRLFHGSEACRSVLVSHAKTIGLFKYHAPPDHMPAGVSLEERWHIWIGQERLRRLSWAIYEYDSSVSYLHHMRPYITVGDVIGDLPCSRAHWEAETAHSWAALHPWGSVPNPKPFRETIRSFFDGTPNPISRITEDSHRQYILLTLIRMLWTKQEISRSPICDLLDRHDWANDRRGLLDAINTFPMHPSATTVVSSSTLHEQGLIARMVQIVHLSNLYGAGDLMDLIHRLVRPSLDHKPVEEGLLRWARRDLQRVRQMAYHAAQILAVVRHFASNLPLEPFNVFHAGVILWCMTALLPQVSGRSIDTTASSEAILPIRLDHLAKEEIDVTVQNIQDWIRSGGNNGISLFSIPDICSSDGQRRVLDLTADILNNMTVWGVARSFRKVVLELRKRQPLGYNATSPTPLPW